eukprot:2189073-Amphidinium_carterae.1
MLQEVCAWRGSSPAEKSPPVVIIAAHVVPPETGEQALMEEVKLVKQKVRGMACEEASPAA